MQPDTEFWFNVVMYGGVITVLLIVGIWLLGVRWKTNKKIDKDTIVKELYNEKERKNGQHKSGARGNW